MENSTTSDKAGSTQLQQSFVDPHPAIPPDHSKISATHASKRKVLRVSLIVIFTVFLISALGFLYLKDKESRKIPSSWSTYKNTYYGYSFKYDPEMLAEPDIYGSKEGEDLGIELHLLDKDKIKTIWIPPFRRGYMIGSDNDRWSLQIVKPELDSENSTTDELEKTCKRSKTNGGFIYYECADKNQAWTFVVNLTSQPKNNAYLRASLGKRRSEFSQEDRLTIKRIVNSFSKKSQMTKTYPTKSDLFRWIKTYWCDGKNKLYEEYSNGLKQYSRYSVLSTSKVLDTVYLTKPNSFCEIPIGSMPFLPLESCPFPETTQVFDNHALGESKQYSICGDALPLDSYEHSSRGITSLIQKSLSRMSIPYGWKYIIMSSTGIALAAPSNWRIQESPLGSCNPDEGCDAEFIEFRDPNGQVLLTVTQENMTTKNTATKEAVNLGKIECGAYAKCELIREKSDNDVQYEYYLLLIGQPNIIAIPKKLTIKFFDNQNQAVLLPQIDRMVQSMIFLYEHQIND